MKQIDPWALLQVRPGDDSAKLKSAYKAAMLEAHPDRGGSNEAASDVTRSYEFLRGHLINGKVPNPAQAGLVMPMQPPMPQQQQFRVVRIVIQSSPYVSPHGSTTSTTSTTFGCWSFFSGR